MAQQQFWEQDAVVTPQGAPGPNPPPGYDLVPLTGADPEKSLDVQSKSFDVQSKSFDVQAGPYEVQRARADATKAEAEARKAEVEAGKGAGDQKRADTVRAITGEVRRLYNQDIKGQPLSRGFGALEYVDALPRNERFTAAGANVLPLIRPLIAQTAKEGDSDKEMTIFQSYVPSADDSDITIEQKLKMLETLVGGMVDGKAPSQLLSDMGATPGAIPAAVVESGGSGGVSDNAPKGPPPLGLQFDPNGNVILQDRSNAAVQGADTGLIGEDGGFHVAPRPGMQGANTTINAMLKEGVPNNEIAEYLKGKGLGDKDVLKILAQIRDVRVWQKQNPGYKGDFKVDIETYKLPNSMWQNIANSDVGVGIASAADAATGFNMDSLIATFGGDEEEARKALAIAQAAHPKSATTGNVAGGVASALGAEAAAAKAGLSGLGRTVAADATFGGVAGAGATDYAEDGTPATMTDRLTGAVKGAAAAVSGGLAGSAVAAGARGVRDPYVREVNIQGIPTTLGQQYGGSRLGGILKRGEDRIAGLPVIGDIINARRVEGIKKFNERAFDRALEPIGVKAGGRVGEEAVDFAQEQVSETFDKALKGKAVTADPRFGTEMTSAITNAMDLPRIGPELADNIGAILEPYMQGTTITGEAMQQMSRELRDLKAGYMTDPMKKRIGEAIDNTEEALFGPFRRQMPEVLPDYNKAKVAQRRLYTLADAVNAAKNREGIFMPSQLGNADRRATIRTEGKVNAARGRGQFHDLQRAAQEVLPSEIPDSGTAGRIIIPGLAMGVGGGSDAAGLTDGVGAPLAGILALAYTRAGQRVLTKPGRGIDGTTGRILKSEAMRRALTAGGASAGALAVAQ